MPDGLRTSTDSTDRLNDTDLTDVETFHSSSFSSAPSTVSATADIIVTNNATVDATATAPCFTQILASSSRPTDVPTLNMLPHAVAEGLAPNITVMIHSVQTPMMLDSEAQISVFPSDIVADFDPPISLPSVTREVQTFGNHQVTLRGPLSLELQMCGFRIRHPFYFIDAPTPVIGGYDLMKAAILVVDVENGLVWSRRPKSATKGPIGPDPEFLVCDNSLHSSVAMTKPQHTHHVVVSETAASSLDGLDIKASPASPRPFGNSTSSLPANLHTPSAHGGRRVPASRNGRRLNRP